MSELQTTAWDETAASNNTASPNGFPEGMAPSGVNDSAREVMAQIKRWFNRITGRNDAGALISSAGSGTTFTVDYDTAPASLYTGLTIEFKANGDFSADATVNCNSLGAKNVQVMTASGYANISAGYIISLQHVRLKYDGTLDKWVMMTPIGSAAAVGTVTSVSTAGLATGGPITGTGTVTVSISAQTELSAAPATDDYIAVYDTSAASHKKVSWDNLIPDASTTKQGKVELATAAEMETATDATRVPSVSVMKNHPLMPKAWCYVTVSGGTPTLAASSNVASITDSGVGRYVVNFTTAFSSASYAAICNSSQNQGASVRWAGMDENATAPTASAFPVGIISSAGAYVDPASWSAVFFGDQ